MRGEHLKLGMEVELATSPEDWGCEESEQSQRGGPGDRGH